MLLVGKSLGLRAGDFVNLTFGKFRGLKLDSPPVFIGETITEKEHVKAYPFLDFDTLPIVRTILETNRNCPNNECILTTRSKTSGLYQKMRGQELSHILQSLATRAKIENGSRRIRFHCMRKFLSDRLASVTSELKWKQVLGKKISESAYISSNSLRDDYAKVMESTCIDVRTNNDDKLEYLEKEKETLVNQMLSMKKTLDEKNTENFNLRYENYNIKSTCEELGINIDKKVKQRNAFYEHFSVEHQK